MFSLLDHKNVDDALNWAESKNDNDTFSWIEQRRLKALKKISKCCFFCKKQIHFWQRSVGCYGSGDYVRAHRKCAKESTNKICFQ